MSSPNDNIQMKDGADATYKLRTKDVSAGSDGSLQYARNLMTPYPVDYGIGGCYQAISGTGLMAAGLAASSPILAFRNPSPTMNALIRRVRIAGNTGGAGFAAGTAVFSFYVARNFTAMDTGGSLASLNAPNGKLRTSMGAPSCAIMSANTGALTPGTRTLDALQTDAFILNPPTTANTIFMSRQVLFEKLAAEHPLVLAQNEGFVILATVPGTGTWTFAAVIEWDEVPVVNY